MARMKPAYYYERQAREAKARDTYYETRVPPLVTAVKNRPSVVAYYRSLLIKQGTDEAVYKVSVKQAAINLVSLAEAGLPETVANTIFPLVMRGSGVKPSQIHWYKGDATPTASRTPWQSRVIRYYDKTGPQSHYSMPFSRATGAFTPTDLKTAFNALFGGTKRASLLGTANGRAYLELETAPIATDT